MANTSKDNTKVEEQKNISLETLKEQYTKYYQQYEKSIKFATRLEGVLEFLSMQIVELEKKENNDTVSERANKK